MNIYEHDHYHRNEYGVRQIKVTLLWADDGKSYTKIFTEFWGPDPENPGHQKYAYREYHERVLPTDADPDNRARLLSTIGQTAQWVYGEATGMRTRDVDFGNRTYDWVWDWSDAFRTHHRTNRGDTVGGFPEQELTWDDEARWFVPKK